jgi:hypothetical protein
MDKPSRNTTPVPHQKEHSALFRAPTLLVATLLRVLLVILDASGDIFTCTATKRKRKMKRK